MENVEYHNRCAKILEDFANGVNVKDGLDKEILMRALLEQSHNTYEDAIFIEELKRIKYIMAHKAGSLAISGKDYSGKEISDMLEYINYIRLEDISD